MSLKVLVIDDHPLVQQGVAAALESLGHDTQVMSARDAEQGMAMAAANPDLDLVLLDLALPGMSGFGLIGRLHERFPSLPVVVLSALEDPENRLARRCDQDWSPGGIPALSPGPARAHVARQKDRSFPKINSACARLRIPCCRVESPYCHLHM